MNRSHPSVPARSGSGGLERAHLVTPGGSFIRNATSLAAGILLTMRLACPAGIADFATNTPTASNLAAKQVPELFPDEIVARGKGLTIKRSQVEEAYIAFKASAAAAKRVIPEARRAEVEKQVLERLINVQLLLQKATESEVARAKATAQTNLETYEKRASSEEAFRRQLIALGMSLEQFKSRLLEEATFEEVINREVKAGITISEAQVKNYYQTNAAAFSVPERVRISRILILTQDPNTRQDLPESAKQEKRKLAGQIAERAKAGEDFAKLARQYSEDPMSRDLGGELAPFGHGYLVPELDKIIWSLRVNQVSEVVQTQFGCHIIKLLEKLPARKIPLGEAEKEVRETLLGRQIQEQLPIYLKKLQAEAGVELLPSTGKN